MMQVVILYIFKVQVQVEDSGQYLKTAHQQTKAEETQVVEAREVELEEAQEEEEELLHVTFQ
jgi:hypothetical protein